MKKTSRFLAIALALCLSLSLMIPASAADIETAGGSGTTNVTLSTTADGSLGGTPAATAMSVTVPTVLPVAAGPDGKVSTATNAVITNNSYGAVKVANVTINAESGWHLADYTTNMAKEKVDCNKIGFALTIGGSEQKATKDGNDTTQVLFDTAIQGCYMTGVGDTSGNTAAIVYDAVVAPISNAVTNTGVATVVFVIEWDI